MLTIRQTVATTFLVLIGLGIVGCSNSPTAPDENANNQPAVPAVPSNLQAQVLANDVVQLLWEDKSQDEDGFIVYRLTGTTKAPGPLDTLPPNTTSYQDATPEAGTSYRYFVRSYNAAGESPPSPKVIVDIAAEATPLVAPSKLTVKTYFDSLQIAWKDNSADEDGFEIHVKYSDLGRNATDTLTARANQTKLLLPLPRNADNFSFRIRAVRGKDRSDFSNSATWSSADQEPDIEVINTDLTAWPTEARPGDTVFLRGWAVRNNGGATQTSKLHVYLRPSSDQLNRTRDAIAYLSQRAVRPGEVISMADEFVILPRYIDDGTYALTLEADPDNQVAEERESNNFRSTVFDITAPDLADLMVTSDVFVVSPRPVDRGQVARVSGVEYGNRGKAASGQFTIGYYVSDNSDITMTDFPIATFSVALGSNDTSRLQAFDFVIPPHLTPGTYYVGAILDVGNRVEEQYEDNNVISIKVEVK